VTFKIRQNPFFAGAPQSDPDPAGGAHDAPQTPSRLEMGRLDSLGKLTALPQTP